MGPLIDALFFAAGLVLLVKSADWLVLGGALIAEGLGVRPLVVGLTIVAFGTSAPELAAGIGAAARDHGEIVIGTVVGSNIANVALILGVASLIRPVPCRRPVVVREMPIMLAAITLGAAAMLGGSVNRWEGIALTAGILVYVALAYRVARRAPDLFEADAPRLGPPPEGGLPRKWWARNAALVLLGSAGLALGAHLLVTGAESIARWLGVSELVIGLTVVAIGTSLPELFTSARAAMTSHSDIAVGNVVGSNVFNSLCVMGVASLVAPLPVPDASVVRDVPVMLGVAALALLLMAPRKRLTRPAGLVLLFTYAAYTAGLVIVSLRA
ncbi:MAG TPA: calcium/sodium antiporter [Phycisphaerales bacterium]|nr:calcium/sodium antiporter [Phycisphaerales bacterium]